jgi:hypothetical protein
MISSSYSSFDHTPSPSPFYSLSHRTDNVAQTTATPTTAAATPPPSTTTTTFSKTKWILLVLFGLTWFNLGRSSRQLRVDGVVAPSSGTSIDPPTMMMNTSTTSTRTSSTRTSGGVDGEEEEEEEDTGGLWVIVPSYSEGISGWMISLAELLVFCKTYNATFVLPRIDRGRLSTPNYINPTTTTTTTKTITQQQQHGMSVLDLFDATLIHDYYSVLVTADDYHTAIASYDDDPYDEHEDDLTNTTFATKALANDNNKINHNNKNHNRVKLFSVCMTFWAGGCNQSEIVQNVPTGRFGPQEGQGMYSPTMEAALQWTKEYPHDMVVLELHQYVIHALSRKRLRPYHANETMKESKTTKTTTRTATQKLISDDEVTHVMQSVFQFHSKYDSLATKALERLGIAPHEPYLTFHWRAEKKDLDYMNCAHALVESKNLVVSQYHNKSNNNNNDSTIGATTNSYTRSDNSAMPVILLSSLNTNVDLEWGGAKNLAYNTSAPQALAYLLQPVQEGGGGFLKLDSVLSQVLQLPTQQQQQQQVPLASTTTTTSTRTSITMTTMTTTTTNNDTQPPPDMIVTVVLDLILALRSHQFVTCTGACIDSFCKDCNVLTKFGNFTLTLRRYRQQQQQQQQARQDRLRGTRQLSDRSRSSSFSTPPRTTTTVNNGDANLAGVWVDPIQHHHHHDYQCWPTRMEEKDDTTTRTRPNTTTIIQKHSTGPGTIPQNGSRGPTPKGKRQKRKRKTSKVVKRVKKLL